MKNKSCEGRFLTRLNLNLSINTLCLEASPQITSLSNATPRCWRRKETHQSTTTVAASVLRLICRLPSSGSLWWSLVRGIWDSGWWTWSADIGHGPSGAGQLRSVRVRRSSRTRCTSVCLLSVLAQSWQPAGQAFWSSVEKITAFRLN